MLTPLSSSGAPLRRTDPPLLEPLGFVSPTSPQCIVGARIPYGRVSRSSFLPLSPSEAPVLRAAFHRSLGYPIYFLLLSVHCTRQDAPKSSSSIGAHTIVAFWGPNTQTDFSALSPLLKGVC